MQFSSVAPTIINAYDREPVCAVGSRYEHGRSRMMTFP
jgi:hypothetical protein